MKFSIVIPSYLNSTGLETCVKSVIEHTDLSLCEIVIVANGAPPETKSLPLRLGVPMTLLWFDEPQGFSKAVNVGIKESTGEFVVLLNDDCVLLDQPKNRWLELLSEPFVDAQVGITGSHKLWDPDTQHEFIIFFCAMLRRKMLDDMGLLDETLTPFYGEDISMCIEAERAGWEWAQVPVGEECHLEAVPNSEHLPEWKRQRWVGNFPISHDSEATLGRLPNHVEVVERNRAKLRQKYGPVNIGRAEMIEGWMGHDELIWLASQARSHQTIVEIGSHLGRSTRAFADNMPESGRVFAVDVWDDVEVYSKFYANLADHINAGRVIPLRIDGAVAARMLTTKANLIFIDGLHDEASIRADILNWQPLLADGGLLCGHDYSDTFPDVVKVVDELLIARQPPNTGIWEALDTPDITESVEGYGGFFCTEKQINSLRA